MAAPAPTPRTLPTGYKLPDGYRALVTFGSNPGISLWEKTVKPPPVEGGDKIDTTTMINAAWRTAWLRQLKTLGDLTFEAAYDPDVLSTIFSQTNRNDQITVFFGDGTTLAFWGGLVKFEPGELKEGEFPQATVSISATNTDNSYAEQAPVLTAAAGT